jgi:hypothetical protein
LGAAVDYDLASRTQKQLFGTWNMGGVSVRGRQALFSRHEVGLLRLMNLDDKDNVRTVYDHGIIPDYANDPQAYDKEVRANLSSCGKRAAFIMNGDLYVLEL